MFNWFKSKSTIGRGQLKMDGIMTVTLIVWELVSDVS
jgi:hypothetical protein